MKNKTLYVYLGLGLIYILFLLYTMISRNSVMINQEYCFSPKKLVMNLKILSILSSIIYPPTDSIAILDLVCLSLTISMFYIGCSNRVKRMFCLYILLSFVFTKLFRTILSTILYFIFSNTYHSLIISHLFHDCSGGIIASLSYPTLIFSFNLMELTTKMYLIQFAMGSISILSIWFYFENCITMLFSLIISIIISQLFSRDFQTSHHRHRLEESLENNNKLDEVNHSKCNKGTSQRSGKFQVILACIVLSGSALARIYGMDGVQYFPSKTETCPLKLGIVISTTERPTNPPYLTRTLESILSQLPPSNKVGLTNTWSNENMKIFVISYYNKLKNHSLDEQVKLIMERNPMAKDYLDFVNGEEALLGLNLNSSILKSMPSMSKLKRHVAAALNFGSLSFPEANWLMIHEDDFILCPRMFNWLMDLSSSIDQTKLYCGVFVATGGAGILVRRTVGDDLLRALLDTNIKDPADVIIQKCLRGSYKNHCVQCRQPSVGLLISSHLIFGHIGFVSSLEHNYYREDKPRWTCGWTHPFNNDPDVDVRHTDTFYI